MNIVKTNVTAYIFRNINLSYERAINRWFSVNMGFGAMPEGKVPFINSFLSDNDEKRFQNLEAKAFNFTIEPRFYLGAGYGKGFILLHITVIQKLLPIPSTFIMTIPSAERPFRFL